MKGFSPVTSFSASQAPGVFSNFAAPGIAKMTPIVTDVTAIAGTAMLVDAVKSFGSGTAQQTVDLGTSGTTQKVKSPNP